MHNQIRPNRSRIINQFKYCSRLAHSLLSQPFILVSFLVALSVWLTWLIMIGPIAALTNMIAHWQIAVTMIFGSMVAGGTSMGGGAVAFPVLTKVLEISPHDAKVFSLAIQTIGMGAASITLITMKTKLEWGFIRRASLGGIPGIIMGSVFLAPILPPDGIRISFSMMITSFALILLSLDKTTTRKPNSKIIHWGKRQQNLALWVGFIGGIISGLVGSGMDIFAFSVMVLLFNVCEKVSTATSVVLMAINAAVGFLVHKFLLGDFIEPVSNYWLAAVPVVVAGAPLGAILCNCLNRTTITQILIGLILIDLISSLLFVPLTLPVINIAVVVFIFFSSLYYFIYRNQRILLKQSKSR